MITNDLLVTGASRFNKVYASEFEGDLKGNADTATSTTYVKHNASNASYGRPILLAYDQSPTDGGSGLVYYDSAVTVNPSTNTITASTFAGNLEGNAKTATTATKVGTSTVGSATQPVYINAGVPTKCTYTLGKSVPSDAKFTDTTYTLGSFGVTATAAELNYCTNVTSDIQTQLNSKTNKVLNSDAYNNLSAAYSGSTSGTLYYKIDMTAAAKPSWRMYYIECSIREDYNYNYAGKLIISGYHSSASGSVWSIKASTDGLLSSNIKVYADEDNNHIYIAGCKAYSNVSIDKVLVGDSARGYDHSTATVTTATLLPTNYKAATMIRGLTSDNYASFVTPAGIGAATSSHTHNYAGSSSAGGSATSAVKLATARTINGVSFDGTSNITVYSPYENSVNSKNLSTAGWYRVASISALGTDSTLEWNISRNYSNTNSEAYQLLLSMAHQTCNFTQINSQVNTAGITKVRLVLASSSPHSSAAYLEVYYNLSVENTVYSYIRGNDGANKSWTNVAFTAGSIPSGYTSKEFVLSSNPIKTSSFEGSLVGNASTATKANVLYGTYTSNGGAQPPSYVGTHSVKCNMMNNFVGTDTSFSSYADVLMMNAYSWSDVPYATALAIQKTNGIPRAWIAAGGNTDAWSGATEIITKNNITSHASKVKIVRW